MIQGNVSAHASFQTCVLLVFYLQWLPWGEVQSAITICLANVEAGGLCQGEGDRERGRLFSRDRGSTPGYAVREGLKYGFKQYFHASCKAWDSQQQDVVGRSSIGVRSRGAHRWDKVRTGRRPQPHTSHLPGLFAKCFFKSHFFNTAALLNSLLLSHPAWEHEAQFLEKTIWWTF